MRHRLITAALAATTLLAAIGRSTTRADDAAATAPAAERGAPAKLPFVLYADAVAAPPYVWSGWMGDTASIAVAAESGDHPHTGAKCMRCDFKASSGYGGVVWQSPANDWGALPGGYDLTGAKKLTVWARGAEGGEVVTFKLGILPHDAKHPDSGSGETEATLTKDWAAYTIDLAGKDLHDIKTGFTWVVASPGKPVTFYLDDVQYE